MKPSSVESFHTVLFCREWDACVNFYREVLGFEEVAARAGFVEVQVTPESRIGLLRHKEGDAAANLYTSMILSFKVGNVVQMHQILSKRCKGVTKLRRHPWGARLFELRDPEGRRLEFWTPL
jgi:catechol 2,3-dioxygenase-like lactoylglutathione lyase family enzyme